MSKFDDESIWKNFLAWLPSAPPVAGPGILVAAYREQLIAGGLSPVDADLHDGVIQRAMRTHADGWQTMFNNIYANANGKGFTYAPCELLVGAIDGRTPGRALDVGMGQGRNAVFLATKGWDVTGFDVSDGGLAMARQSAAQAGVKLNAVHSTEQAFDYGREAWDLIVLTYEPFPVTQSGYADRLHASLKPGGAVVIESFSAPEEQGNRPATAIDADRLLEAFRRFRLVYFENRHRQGDWGPPRRIVRMIAERR